MMIILDACKKGFAHTFLHTVFIIVHRPVSRLRLVQEIAKEGQNLGENQYTLEGSFVLSADHLYQYSLQHL